jgi:AcrR family transcriptional regulator
MPRHHDSAPRPYARGRGREAELLDAAASAFAHRGYHGTTIAVIAAEAGMTQAGVLYHHESKAHLYRTVVKTRVAPEELAEMEGAVRLDDMVERIVAYVRWMAPRRELLRFRAVFSGEALIEDSPATDILIAEHRGSLRILRSRIDAARDSGEIRGDVDATSAALELMAINEGLRHLTVAHEDLFDYADMFERSIRRWYGDLARGESSR